MSNNVHSFIQSMGAIWTAMVGVVGFCIMIYSDIAVLKDRRNSTDEQLVFLNAQIVEVQKQLTTEVLTMKGQVTLLEHTTNVHMQSKQVQNVSIVKGD